MALSKKDIDAIKKATPGARKRLAREKATYLDRIAKPIDIKSPEWVKIEGVDALQIAGSKFVAVPCTGRKNAANFYVVDLTDRKDAVCYLKKNEVYSWLQRAA